LQATAAQAFREFMDEDDGLLFRAGGEPLQGGEAIFNHLGGAAPETGKLLWEPVRAWASESGDLGASWGRSRFQPNDPTQPARAWRYMTVWRRDSDGKWKGLMDMGIAADDLVRPAPVAPAAPPTLGAPTAGPTPTPAAPATYRTPSAQPPPQPTSK
jgi:ketosteroid isomerase-like protein